MDKRISDEEAARLLNEREAASGMQYDTPTPKKDETPVAPVTSLGKSQAWHDEQNMKDTIDDVVPVGWKPFPVSLLPSSGQFYPEGTTMMIRPASVEEIRHFSTIDENDPLDLDDKLNMIMSKCLIIKFPDRHAMWKDLKEEDRFCLVFAIRDITFKNGENKLFVTMQCGGTCTGDGSYNEKIEMKNENFEYYKIDPKLMRFFDPNEKCFKIVNPKVGEITMYIPSLGVTTFIKNYMRDRIKKGERYDKTFLKVAPFILSDWRNLNEKTYQAIEQDSWGWNPLKLSAILQMAEMIRFGVKTRITRQCNKCGAEVSTSLTFPGGVKSLFLFASPLDELMG